jgi:hypothetical protein
MARKNVETEVEKVGLGPTVFAGPTLVTILLPYRLTTKVPEPRRARTVTALVKQLGRWIVHNFRQACVFSYMVNIRVYFALAKLIYTCTSEHAW